MTDKIGHIKNPLTIIAIFAGLAEVGGTIVLPLLQPTIQATYVWFLIFFPTFLVGVFFWVLYTKHHVLYAPSDYRDDSIFRDIVQGSTEVETLKENKDEAINSLSFNEFSTEARKVLKTLWTYQNQQFPDNEANRWAFGIAIGSPDYLEYKKGVDELIGHELVAVDRRGLCYLTNIGLQFCKDSDKVLKGYGDLWSKFSN